MDQPRRPSPPLPAQGAFREALAALRNLSNLVRARNVGPRPILDLVPDVRSVCGPLTQAAADVLDAVQPSLDPAPLAELRAFIDDRVGLLTRELDAAQSGTMNARQRLHLEQALGDLWRDLNGARALLAMLESSVFELDLTTDLVELVQQTYSGPPSGGQVHGLIPAYLHCEGEEVALQRPRTMAAILACAAELVAAREGGATQITVTRVDGGWTTTLSLTSEPRGLPLTVWGYGAVPPGLSCLRAAARQVGLSVAWSPDSWALTLQGKS